MPSRRAEHKKYLRQSVNQAAFFVEAREGLAMETTLFPPRRFIANSQSATDETFKSE